MSNDVPEFVNDECELLYNMLVSNSLMQVGEIIDDVLGGEGTRWDPILIDWISKDFYWPVYNIRDGHLTEFGKMYAYDEYGILPLVE